MNILVFPCGDVQPVKILEYSGDEVCVQMPFGPFWTKATNVDWINAP